MSQSEQAYQVAKEQIAVLEEENAKLKAEKKEAAEILTEYFIIFPRDRNKSDELIYQARKILKGE